MEPLIFFNYSFIYYTFAFSSAHSVTQKNRYITTYLKKKMLSSREFMNNCLFVCWYFHDLQGSHDGSVPSLVEVNQSEDSIQQLISSSGGGDSGFLRNKLLWMLHGFSTLLCTIQVLCVQHICCKPVAYVWCLQTAVGHLGFVPTQKLKGFKVFSICYILENVMCKAVNC